MRIRRPLIPVTAVIRSGAAPRVVRRPGAGRFSWRRALAAATVLASACAAVAAVMWWRENPYFFMVNARSDWKQAEESDFKQAEAAFQSRNREEAFLAGQLSISFDISDRVIGPFTSAPVERFKSGDTFAAMMSSNEAWSEDTRFLPIGPVSRNLARCSILAMVRCSDGVHTVFPVVLTPTAAVEAGKMVHSGGYRIEARGAVKAGDRILATDIGDAVLSIATVEEAASAATAASNERPWVAVFKDDMKPSRRVSAIEAWLIVKARAGRWATTNP